MSSRAMAWAWAQDLKAGPKFLLVALADRADEFGLCYPGAAWIMKKTGFSRGAILSNLIRLEKLKMVKVNRRKRDDGSNASNIYRLMIPEDFALRKKDSKFHDQAIREFDMGISDSDIGISESDSKTSNKTSIKTGLKDLFKRQARSFPNDFQVTDQHREWARANGYRSPDLLFEAFRDHHLSKGSRFTDWDAALRTWVRNDTEKFGNKREEDEPSYWVVPEHLKLKNRRKKDAADN